MISDKDSLRVLDSQCERFRFETLNASVGPGHYRLPLLERFAPRTWHFGPGRIFIDGLSERDISALVFAEKAELRFERALKFDHLPTLPITKPPPESSIHGGGEKLFKPVAIGKRQPLTPSESGIRLHNDELMQLIEYLEPRLSIGQLVVLTVLREAA